MFGVWTVTSLNTIISMHNVMICALVYNCVCWCKLALDSDTTGLGQITQITVTIDPLPDPPYLLHSL